MTIITKKIGTKSEPRKASGLTVLRPATLSARDPLAFAEVQKILG
jgi:hypothetical protein